MDDQRNIKIKTEQLERRQNNREAVRKDVEKEEAWTADGGLKRGSGDQHRVVDPHEWVFSRNIFTWQLRCSRSPGVLGDLLYSKPNYSKNHKFYFTTTVLKMGFFHKTMQILHLVKTFKKKDQFVWVVAEWWEPSEPHTSKALIDRQEENKTP